ncbi:MAG: acetate--CoA ligase family protein [Desulfobacula sp.]|nr:acetate--CoA ligase family protein [Desulfobacula sp.]
MKLTDIQKLIDTRLRSSSKTVSKTSSISKSIPEDEAKKILKLFHIPVVEEKKETDVDRVLTACRKTGFPVVLKGIGATILHKTESGLVRVGLSTRDQVLDAVNEMKKAAKDSIEAFLIQPVVSGKREFVAGMFKDPQFGPVIIFGLGGILTEALNDIALKIAPLNDADMEDMFEQLSSKRLLNDFRGEKAVKKQAVKKILRGLSDIALAYPNIKEIDINPLIIQPDGSPVAVDGLIVLEEIKKEKHNACDIDLKKLASCYYPKSIAFIGASATPGKWGHMLLTNTLSRDFKGKVYLVNPKGGKITGRHVYKSIAEIEEDVELAVVTIPANRVIDLIPDLKKKIVKEIL